MKLHVIASIATLIAMPIRAQPNEQFNELHPNNDNYCQYDSQCDAGYYCYQNACTHLLPTLQPTVTPQIEEPIETYIPNITFYEGSVMNNADNDPNQAQEIIVEPSESETIIQEMDDCGNVYDAFGNLIWGSGECELSNETVTTVTNNVPPLITSTQQPLQTPDINDYPNGFVNENETEVNDESKKEEVNISKTSVNLPSDNKGLIGLVVIVGISLLIATLGYFFYEFHKAKKK